MAALSVFCVHFKQESGFSGISSGFFDANVLLVNGNSGVALFFVLSGFLLSIPFWGSPQLTGNIASMRRYWAKRAARILPAYYLCLTVLVIENGYWAESSELKNIMLHYLCVFNYSNDYFYSINPPFWTIAIEMQFYVLLPIIFVALGGLSRKVQATGIVLLVLACYLAQLVVVRILGSQELVVSHSLLAHLPIFLMGVFAGYLHVFKLSPSKKVSLCLRRWELIFWTSWLTVLLVLSTPLHEVIALPYGRYTFPVVPLLFMFMLLSAPRTVYARNLLEGVVLKRIGLISYGIYLFHLPVLKLCSKTFGHFGIDITDWYLAYAIISLSATVMAASVSYLCFERPILSFVKKRLSDD